MAGKKRKPISIRGNISSLNKQIRTKGKRVQKIIDQKQGVRQSYLEAMEKLRKNTTNKLSSIENIQDDFTSTMERLDKEEESFNLEIKELSERRAQLNKRIIDKNASLFFPKKALALTIIVLVASGSGLLLSQKHQLFNQPSAEKGIQN